eukprot:CAMPEP_0171143586 /NCGR_PEP_ID=MMETSP0766_2-20121228/144548_1 /TAXON_ID=439317 /ORGANISM="Gambierdiscus australes, Strain CAWD 149" /LENGTH=70 /DNA_ID=CAMNT_0011607415 /DNA_START=67 /DNA_END=275 /DNA_ORIENTATION=+
MTSLRRERSDRCTGWDETERIANTRGTPGSAPRRRTAMSAWLSAVPPHGCVASRRPRGKRQRPPAKQAQG